MSFNQSGPTVPTVLNTSNCFVFGNTASGNALSVQQLGAGNVASFRTTTGATALFVNAAGNVGVGTAGPNGTAHVWNVAATGGPKLSIGDNTAFAPGGLHSIAALTSTLGAGNGNSIILGRTNATNDAFQMTFMNVAQGSTTNYLGFNAFGSSYTAALAITAGGNVGIGTTVTGSVLDVYTADTTYGIRHTTGTIAIASYIASGSASAPAQFGTTTNHKLGFYTNNGGPSVILDTNGRLGIGTASPGYALDVSGSARVNTGTSNVIIGGGQGLGQGGLYMYPQSSVPGTSWNIGAGLQGGTANAITFVSGTNVGIGTTNPGSAWSGALLDVYASGTGVSSNVNISAGCDGSASGSNKASVIFNTKGSGGGIVTGGITQQLLGSSYGFNFQPFTLGTSVMVIKGDGNVGIGTTSPDAALDVYSSQATARMARICNFKNDGGSQDVCFIHTDQPFNNAVWSGSALTVTTYPSNGTNNAGYIAKFGTSDAAGGSPDPKVVISSAYNKVGFVGIGTTSPGALLDVYGGAIRNFVNGDSVIVSECTNATNYAYYQLRVNTSGTPVYGFLTLKPNGQLWFCANNGYTTGMYLVQNGTAWSSSSDARLKNIIEPISNALSKVDQINPVIYSLKSDETNKRRVGVIAQDVYKVLPEAVDSTPESEQMMGVQYSDLIPLALAAIKELSAENTALKSQLASMESRIAALESKLAA